MLILCRYKNRLFLAIDGNYKLKNFKVSSEKNDPAFGDGLAYFVPTSRYQEYVKMWEPRVIQKVLVLKFT